MFVRRDITPSTRQLGATRYMASLRCALRLSERPLRERGR